jgi:predicted O-methyltransferase YrrM
MRKELFDIIGLEESLYTNFAIHPDCQGWSEDFDVFEMVLKNKKPNLIIEVGTWKGSSAITIGNLCTKLNYNDTQILCVDTWLGSEEHYTWLTDWKPDLKKINGFPSIYYTFLSNIVQANLQANIIPFGTTSSIAASVLKYFNIKADLIYLDASHDYESVKSDLKAYYELLNDGGSLIGDDYSSMWQGVIDAATEFASEKQIDIQIHKSRFLIRK